MKGVWIRLEQLVSRSIRSQRTNWAGKFCVEKYINAEIRHAQHATGSALFSQRQFFRSLLHHFI